MGAPTVSLSPGTPGLTVSSAQRICCVFPELRRILDHG